jgi:hypothetical protein
MKDALEYRGYRVPVGRCGACFRLMKNRPGVLVSFADTGGIAQLVERLVRMRTDRLRPLLLTCS